MVASPESAHRAAQAFPRNLGEELEEAQRELLEELGREARARASSGIAAASAQGYDHREQRPSRAGVRYWSSGHSHRAGL